MRIGRRCDHPEPATGSGEFRSVTVIAESHDHDDRLLHSEPDISVH
ncbi:hypothetical protein ACFQ3B_14235 [Stackebrandtia endophytica]|nr:hypothetical protein [Stackebrandtia endophytica]